MPASAAYNRLNTLLHERFLEKVDDYDRPALENVATLLQEEMPTH